MPNVLLVCTANICRSPVAEAVLKDRLRQSGFADVWQVTSAGTWANWGNRASENSVLVLAERGLDINEHRSKPVSEGLLAGADLVLCMEVGHKEALQAEFRDQAAKIHLLSEMAGPGYSIVDPFGGPLEDYKKMLEEVTGLIDEGLPRIVELAERNAHGH